MAPFAKQRLPLEELLQHFEGWGGGGGESKFSVEKHLESLCPTKGGFLFMVWCQGGFDS